MIQLSVFSTGGYVVHRIQHQHFKGKSSAWFGADGKLLDAELIRGEKSYPVVVGGPVWGILQTVGKAYSGKAREIYSARLEQVQTIIDEIEC